MFTGMGLGAFIGVFISVLTYFRGDIPASLFTQDAAYIIRAAEYLKGFAPEAILTCVVFSYIGFFNGHGNSMPVMFQGITASFLVRVPLSWWFSLRPDADLYKIGLAVPGASLYGIIFFTICYIWHINKYKKTHCPPN